VGAHRSRHAPAGAHALSRSFGQAFEHALRHIRDDEPSRGWREHVATVVLRLFQHRQIEILLQPFNSEHSIPDCWTGLHAAYRYAEFAGMLWQPLVTRRCHEECGEETTLERNTSTVAAAVAERGHLSPHMAC
jgi:hypothetical protein